MSPPKYWLSASVLTMTSAPSFRHASRPAWKPAARPLLFVRRTMWSTPCSRATATVAVGRAVVDDEPLDGAEAVDLAREVGERRRERLLLVEAGDLDDELHAREPEYDARWRLVTARGPARVVPYTRALSMPDDRAARPNTVPSATFARVRALNWPALLLGALILGDRRGHDRLPDVHELRLDVLAALGPRAAARPPAVVRRLPRADPAPARRRLRRAAGAARATGATACWCSLTLASFVVLVVGLYRLGRTSFTSLVGHRRRRHPLHALRLPVPRRARLRRHPVPRARDLGGRPGGRSARAAAARPAAAGARRAAAPGGLGAERLLLAVAVPEGDAGASAIRTRCSSPPRRCCGSRPTSSSPATRCSRRTTRAAWRRSSGATRASPRCRRRWSASSSRWSSCRSPSPG